MVENILIAGTGAMATLFAARLAGTGVNVTMLGTWPEGLAALREKGARFVDASGSIHAHPVHVAGSPKACQGVHFALVLVKSWQTERTAGKLTQYLAEDGLVVTLQNGLGNREILTRNLGMDRVAMGVTTTGATLIEPGLARLGGEGSLSLEIHPRLSPLNALLASAGFDVHLMEDVNSLIWGKLVINAAINPLTALLRIPNGELLKRPSARRVMAELAREAAAVAVAQGVVLPFNDPVFAVEEVANRTALNYSSMLQDVLRGALTEIDSICGAIVRAGEEKGVSAPVNHALWRLVRALAIEK